MYTRTVCSACAYATNVTPTGHDTQKILLAVYVYYTLNYFKCV
jgi:hypothetical protein